MNFITGATGFVGSYLADALLKEGEELVVLSRASKDQSAEDRFLKALELTGTKDEQAYDNMMVCEGDVTLDDFGLSYDVLDYLINRGMNELWHSAGSISFAEKDRSSTFDINVGGMINLLAFVEKVGVKEIHYISTAYSDGNKSSITFYDEKLPRFNNPYEESKSISEAMLMDWADKNPEVRVVVYKLSIVVGDISNGRAFNFSGYYRFMQVFHFFRAKIQERSGQQENGIVDIPIVILGCGAAEINLVTIDYVVDQIMGIRDTNERGPFYIINNSAPRFDLVIKNAIRFFGISGIKHDNNGEGRKTETSEDFKRIEKMISRGMVDYIPYISWTYRWDQSSTKKALGEKYTSHHDFDYAFTEKMLSYAVQHNFDLMV